MRCGILLPVVSLMGCSPIEVDLLNSGFDLWCGDALCNWTVEQGEVEKTGTWHQRDYGAQLVGDPVVLYQSMLVEDLVRGTLTFDVVADFDDDARIVAEVDTDGVGDANFNADLRGDWHVHTFDRDVETSSGRLDFRVRKSGRGEATLARFAVTLRYFNGPQFECFDGEGCTDGFCFDGLCLPILEDGGWCRVDDGCRSGFCALDTASCQTLGATNRSLGWPCEEATQCESGFCDTVCAPHPDAGTVADGDPCAIDVVCVSGFCDPDAAACVTPVDGTLAPGRHCTLGRQCASGACTDAVCE